MRKIISLFKFMTFLRSCPINSGKISYLKINFA